MPAKTRAAAIIVSSSRDAGPLRAVLMSTSKPQGSTSATIAPALSPSAISRSVGPMPSMRTKRGARDSRGGLRRLVRPVSPSFVRDCRRSELDGVEGSGGGPLQLEEPLLESGWHPGDEAEQLWHQPDLKTGARDQCGHGAVSDAAGRCDERAHACFVSRQPARIVPAGAAELLGQNVRPDHGDAGAPTHGRAWGVAGVADQGYPAPGPAVHHDLADGVEVEVVGRIDDGQQPRNLP